MVCFLLARQFKGRAKANGEGLKRKSTTEAGRKAANEKKKCDRGVTIEEIQHVARRFSLISKNLTICKLPLRRPAFVTPDKGKVHNFSCVESFKNFLASSSTIPHQ